MAKGPVAALHLLPLGLALAPLRASFPSRKFAWAALPVLLASAVGVPLALAELFDRYGDRAHPLVPVWWLLWTVGSIALLGVFPRRRYAASAALVLSLLFGALVMIAWALYCSLQGGEKFALDLLLHQTGGRVVNTFAHSRPALFYVPVLLAGALPATPVFFLARPTGLSRRLLVACGCVVLMLMLIDGKQPHYLLPLFPALALCAAHVLQEHAGAGNVLRRSAVLLLGVLLVALVAGTLLGRKALIDRFGGYGQALWGSPLWWSAWAAGGVSCALALRELRRRKLQIPATCLLLLLGVAAVCMPIQYALGRLSLPRRLLAVVNGEPQTPLATYQASRGGFFNWNTGRDRIDALGTPADLEAWCREHPGGWVIQPVALAAETPDAPLRDEVVDLYRGNAYALRRVVQQEPPEGRARTPGTQ